MTSRRAGGKAKGDSGEESRALGRQGTADLWGELEAWNREQVPR